MLFYFCIYLFIDVYLLLISTNLGLFLIVLHVVLFLFCLFFQHCMALQLRQTV